MDYKEHELIIEGIRKIEKSLRVSVEIPHDEVDRLVVERLIGIRNSEINKHSDMSHFDKVLKSFLTEDEFVKYVVRETIGHQKYLMNSIPEWHK
jgi:hypothetical protein